MSKIRRHEPNTRSQQAGKCASLRAFDLSQAAATKHLLSRISSSMLRVYNRIIDLEISPAMATRGVAMELRWQARVKQLYGSEPEISWFDTPVIVNN